MDLTRSHAQTVVFRGKFRLVVVVTSREGQKGDPMFPYRMGKLVRAWVLVAIAVTTGVTASQAAAHTVAPGWIASDYATGFPTPNDPQSAGPLGLAFDG